MVQVRGNFRIAVVAHPCQMRAGLRIGKNRVRAEQRQRKPQIAGERGKPAQQGHIAHAAACRRVIAGKKAFFFHIKAYNHAQGWLAVATGRIVDVVGHAAIISPSWAHGNAANYIAPVSGWQAWCCLTIIF